MKTKTDSTPASAGGAIDNILSTIRKQFGEGSILRLGTTQALNIETLSTGSLAVDVALGVGGMPKGRIIEVFGPESSGKTTFCLSVIAEAQRAGGVAAIVDVEHAIDPKWAKRCGVNTDELLISQPDCGEDALTIVEHLLESRVVDVIVIDSVAALVPKSELEGQMGDATVGAQARLMSQAMRRLTAVIARTKTVCIFTNQIREKIGVIYGSPEYQPGGRALKFFSTVRIDLRRKDALKNAEAVVTGHRTRFKIVKNKVAAPFVEAEVDIDFTEGISEVGSLIDLGLEHRLLENKGAYITHNGGLLGQGREAAKQFQRETAGLRSHLRNALRTKLLFPAAEEAKAA
jgi:recombination protein RecA